MVTECHRPDERNKVQAFNDFLIFGSMAVGSFSSGMLLASFGWTAVNEVMFPVVLAAGALLHLGSARPAHQSLPDRLSVAQLERHDHQHQRESDAARPDQWPIGERETVDQPKKYPHGECEAGRQRDRLRLLSRE